MRGHATGTVVPAELESARAKLVYLYLSTHGDRTVEELNADLSMTKLALYGVLDALRSRGFVCVEGGRYTVD